MNKEYLSKASSLVSQMTAEEKAGMLSGFDTWHTKAVERLGIDEIFLSDGPHGLRKQTDTGDNLGIGESVPAVCFPSAAAAACSFDRDLVSEVGQAIGQECAAEEVSVILGPGVNIKRNPLCGRNFEYYSEDPVVAGELGSAMIRGIQKTGTGACLKHFAVNNQEKRRMTINAIVDERALREIYLRPFEIAVKNSSPMTVMGSYNKIDGTYSCENPKLLTEILREEWGYEGTVVSDWGAVHDRMLGVKTGLDLEMPGNEGFNDRKVLVALQEGSLSEEELDKTVTRVVAFALECMDLRKGNFSYDKKEHHELSAKVSARCAVLLKNEGLLPAKAETKAAVIGEFAEKPRYQGAGSSKINPIQVDIPLEIMKQRGMVFSYSPGYRLKWKRGEKGSEKAAEQKKLVEEAVAAAAESEIVYLFAGLPEGYETEGVDREDMKIPEEQNELIEAVCEANPKTVVILMGGAPMELPWFDKAGAVLMMYLGGEGMASALVKLLLGEQSPSGKLAETWPMKIEDVPSYHYFPGDQLNVQYRESIYVGYRYYGTAGKKVRFPFGFGLSYTSFEYSSVRVEQKDKNTFRITVDVENTGEFAGYETVFLFSSHDSEGQYFPGRELRDFNTCGLQPGEKKKLEFSITDKDLAYYDMSQKRWITETGTYDMIIASSADDPGIVMPIEIEGEKIPESDLKQKAPLYFSVPDGELRIPDEQFEAVYGKKLPERVDRIERPYLPEHTLEQVGHTFVGKILNKYADKLAAEVSKAEEGQEGMMAAAMKEMPFFALAASGGDMFPEKMEFALLELLNGHLIKAVRELLKK